VDSIDLLSLREIYKEEASRTASSFRYRRVRKARMHAATDVFHCRTNLVVSLGERRSGWEKLYAVHQENQGRRRIIQIERYAGLATDGPHFERLI
jgi:hypothetical protein